MRPELLGRRTHHHDAPRIELGFDLRLGKRGDGVGVHPADDLGRCLGRHKESEP